MKKSILRLIVPVLILPLLVITTRCKYYNEEDLTPPPPPCDTTVVTYTLNILPIVDANCIACHSSLIATGGIILDTYDQARIPALNGMLWNAVSWAPGFPYQMPKGGAQLPACDLAQIKRWLNTGLPQ